MRTFLGMILGCLLTVGVVYVHDARATSALAGDGTSRAIVNWDVARREWNHVQDQVRVAWTKLKTDYNG